MNPGDSIGIKSTNRELLARLDPMSRGMLLAIQSLNDIQTGRVSIRKVAQEPRETSSGTPRGIFTE